jgi:hypothetical protein
MVIAAATRTNSSFQEHELTESRTPATVSPPVVVSNPYKCLLVFAGSMAMFQVIGINSSYGVFQAYYSSEQSFLPPNTSQASIAFVGTLGINPSTLAKYRIRLKLGTGNIY